MSARVVVFLDYQNVYRGARRAFHRAYDPPLAGQVDPVGLATRIAADSPFDRWLAQVRIYRGRPIAAHDPIGHAANRRQLAAWTRSPLVASIQRPLRYPHGWPNTHAAGEAPQEKGVDVALALDFAVMAVRGEYDVGSSCRPTPTSPRPWSSWPG